MLKSDWEQTLDDLKKEVASIKGRAGISSIEFEEMRKRAESFKVSFLKHRLEERRRSVARSRGYTSITKDRKKFGASLGAAAVGSIVAGIASRDKFIAVKAGLSGFDATLRGLGETLGPCP